MAKPPKSANKAPSDIKGGVSASGYDRAAIMPVVFALMAEGQSLRRICESVVGMPKHSTILSWVREDDELANHYARAITNSAEYGFDALQDLPSDVVAKYLSEGWEPNSAIAMAKLELDKEKWRLARMHPKKYGDFQRNEISGDQDNPLHHVHKIERVVIDVKKTDD